MSPAARSKASSAPARSSSRTSPFYGRASEELVQPAGAEPIGPCPYPGLAYFGPDDADLFFGRDAAITRLAAAVGQQSLTALVGASGSGKSSVVLAGLAPRLQGAGRLALQPFPHRHGAGEQPVPCPGPRFGAALCRKRLRRRAAEKHEAVGHESGGRRVDAARRVRRLPQP